MSPCRLTSFFLMLCPIALFSAPIGWSVNLRRVLFCIPDAMMNDPRFVSCMDETSGPEDPQFMTVFAKCYSFAGRPR